MKLDISWSAILKVALAVICFYILFCVKEVLIWFVFAVIISMLFEPAIDFLQKRKVPRVLGATLVYVGFFGIFSLVIYLVAPIFAKEVNNFTQSLPHYLEKVSPSLKQLGFKPIKDIQGLFSIFGNDINSASSNVLSGLFAFFGGVLTTLFIIGTAFFLSIEEKVVEKSILIFLPKKHEASVMAIWERCKKRVVGWFVSRLISCAFVGVACAIAFFLFKMEYPLILALFAGVFNFIPYIGPLVTGIVLAVLLTPVSMVKAIFVLAVFLIIQKIEGAIISPILTKKIVGIPSSLVLVSLVIGGELWGILGAILVIPLVGILFEFFEEYFMKRKLKELE